MDMKIESALALINELQEENHDKEVVIDLLHEDVADRDELIRSLKGQLQNLKLDRTYAVG
jgi:hypothetical protein